MTQIQAMMMRMRMRMGMRIRMMMRMRMRIRIGGEMSQQFRTMLSSALWCREDVSHTHSHTV